MKILLIDNYDSFTYMLADYIKQCGAACTVVRNDDAHLLNQSWLLSFDGYVLSPGPSTPKQAAYLMHVIHEIYMHKPVLGICLGHQAIGEFFGAKLTKAFLPKHGKTEFISHSNHILFENIPTYFEVTRYHSLIVEDIKQPLSTIAQSDKNECMALYHKELPIFGVQFHPESCLTTTGLTIIKNYIKLVKQYPS
jgi:para-aminobenzoate synthetase component 2